MRRPGQSKADDILVIAEQRHNFVSKGELERVSRRGHQRFRVHTDRTCKCQLHSYVYRNMCPLRERCFRREIQF